MNLQRIGVIGAGQMGSGIAHVCALAGYEVLLNDIARDKLEHGLEVINGNLSRQVARGKISDADKDRTMNKIRPATSLDMFKDVDLAIEAATEDESVSARSSRISAPGSARTR